MPYRIPLFRVNMSRDAARASTRTMLSGYIGEGPVVKSFEGSVAPYLANDGRPVLATNSCTSAIELALMTARLRGARIVTTPLTCTATNAPIIHLENAIIWADVDPLTGLIDYANAIQAAAAYCADAIVIVDWCGKRARMPINSLPVIRDAAHSFASCEPYTPSTYECYSFGPIKHLTTIDGGALVAPPAAARSARLRRWYGLDREVTDDFRCEQRVQIDGMKLHMNDVNASVGLANLPSAITAARMHETNARFLHHRLSIGGPHASFQLAPFVDGCPYWVFPLLVSDRDAFQSHLNVRNIQSSQVHSRNDGHPIYRAFAMNQEEPRPGLDYFSRHQVNVPCGWWVDGEGLDRIAEAVLEWGSMAPPLDPPPGG